MPAAASPRRIALVGFLSLAIAMGVGRFAFTPLLAMIREDGLVTVSEGGVIAPDYEFILGQFISSDIGWGRLSRPRFRSRRARCCACPWE